MKILIIDALGSKLIAFYDLKLCESLSELNNNVTLWVPTIYKFTSKKFNIQKSSLHNDRELNVFYRTLHYIFWLFRVIFFSYKWKPEIIHWQFGFFSFFDFICLKILKIRKKWKNILTIHDIEPAHLRFNNLFFRKPFFRQFNGLISHSNEAKRFFLKWIGSINKRTRINVIPFGPFIFNRAKNLSESQIRKLFNISKNGPIILTLGTINENKDYVKCLNIIFSVQKKLPFINYIIAGSTGEEIVRKLIKTKFKAPFPEKIIIINKFLTDEEVDLLHSIADISLLIYKSSATSGAAIKSICSGVPVLCNNLPGFSACIKNNENGMILSNDNEKDSQKIYDVLINREILDSLKRGAKNSYKDYTWQDIATMHFNFYKEVLND